VLFCSWVTPWAVPSKLNVAGAAAGCGLVYSHKWFPADSAAPPFSNLVAFTPLVDVGVVSALDGAKLVSESVRGKNLTTKFAVLHPGRLEGF